MKKLFAFTLAEVVLTMSIVGVVAAMTIPTLSYNRMKKEYSTKLKNFYSHMENAIVDMQIDKGDFRDINIASNKIDGKDGYNWYIDTIDPYMGHQYVNTSDQKIYFKDGSSIYHFNVGNCLELHYDVNADKGPNKYGYDRFVFLMCFTDADRNVFFANKDVFFGTYASGLNAVGTTRAQMLNKCKDPSTAVWCSRLLQNDQWEFKSDYPYKF